MTALTLRPADPGRDNAALCALARRCPLGGGLSFYHQRDDFRERGRLQPHSDVLVAEEAGAIAGCGSVARKTMALGGALLPAAYVFDLMVDPPYRDRGVGRRLLRALVGACPGARVVYAHVLDGNLPSRRLFEGEGFRAHRRRLVFHALLPRLEGRPSRGAVGPVPADPSAAAEIDSRLRDAYNFLDTTTGHDGLFLRESADGRAWAALRRHGPKVCVRAPWYVRPLVRPGRPVLAWSLHHLAAEGRRPGAALDGLLRAAAWAAARRGIDLLLVPLFDGDPHNAVLRRHLLPRWGPSAGATRLYVAGPSAKALLGAARPLLLSGRDG